MDTQLVKRAQDGDERAFEALVVAVHPRLFRVAFGITRDAEAAEDATQRAFLDAWRYLSRLRDQASFLPWSLGFLIDACRALTADDAEIDDELVAEGAANADPFGRVVDRDRLARTFRRLSFDDRVVLVLRYLADLAPEQAAVALDLKPAEVGERTTTALETLGRAIDGDPAATTELVPQTEGA